MGIKKEWKIAGYADEYSRIGKKVPSGKISVLPGVTLNAQADRLEWPTASMNQGRLTTPTSAMFTHFIQLWDKPAEEIAAFARKWGPLAVDPYTILGPSRTWPLLPVFSEPVSEWRHFSRRADAVLTIAAHLQKRTEAHAADWGAFSSLQPYASPEAWRRLYRYPIIAAGKELEVFARWPINIQRSALSTEITAWLKLSGLGFAFDMNQESEGQIEISYSGSLFAAVALQLSLTACHCQGLHICSGFDCGKVYWGTKNVKYCPGCGKGASLEKADERRRAKIRLARDLYSQGFSITEIVKQLKVRDTMGRVRHSSARDTVRRWIEKGH